VVESKCNWFYGSAPSDRRLRRKRRRRFLLSNRIRTWASCDSRVAYYHRPEVRCHRVRDIEVVITGEGANRGPLHEDRHLAGRAVPKIRCREVRDQSVPGWQADEPYH
jgi:hypothetical protein